MKNLMMTSAMRLSLGLLVGTVSVLAGNPVFAQEASATQEPRIDIARYVIDGETDLSATELQGVLAPFSGQQRSLTDIEQAARTLEKYLHEQGYVFLRVYVPAQKPSQGQVTLRIIRFSLANVSVVGNEHFSAENVRRSLPGLQEGVSPEMKLIGRDLSAANANPSKQAAITFREGSKPETVDAEIRLRDVSPLKVFGGYTANKVVEPRNEGAGSYRLAVGVQHSNLFDRDHVATLSYTTDPGHVSSVTLLGAYYQMPVYGRGLTLSAYYTYSDVDSGRVQQGGGFFDLSGKGRFYGIRLTQVLSRIGNTQQTLAIALDERYFENSSTFAGVKIQPDVASRPLSLKYAVQQDGPWGSATGSIEYATNLRGGAANNRRDYQLNGGDHAWDAWRYEADVSLNRGQWNFDGRFRGQWSNDQLIAGEQFGIGGPFSVRGFADRELVGDYGYSWRIEAKAPEVLLAQLRPVMFVDGGEAHSRAIRSTERVMSAGVGLRWLSDHVEAALDLARVLDRNRLNPDNPRTRLNFVLFFLY